MINDTRETVIEGGRGYGYDGGGYGAMGIILFIVVLIVLFAAFRRDGFGGGEGHHGGGHGGFGPGWGGFGGCFPAASTPMTTMELAKINRDQAVDTGAIIHALDVQTCDIQKGQANIIQNQQQIAAAQERTFFTEKLADMREKFLCAEAKALQQESLWQNKFLQQETVNAMGQQFCNVNRELDSIKCDMLRRPPAFPLTCSPCSVPSGFPFAGGERFERFERGGCNCEGR